jgi:hypothetical protein
MKRSTFLLAAGMLAFSSALQAQQLYDDFEDTRSVEYGFATGFRFEYIPNVSSIGNPSLTIGQYIRNAGAQFDVMIVESGQLADVSDYLSGAKTMTMDVYSPAAGIPIEITLEDTNTADCCNFPVGRHSNYIAFTTVANAWETLTFSLVSQPDPSVPNTAVERVVVLFNPNTFTGDNYFFDNFFGPELAADPCGSVVEDLSIHGDFECQHNFGMLFKHGDLKREPNPSSTGNPSANALRYIRNAGIDFDVIYGLFEGGALDLNARGLMKMKVYDTNAPSDIIMSIQDALGNVIVEATASTTASNTWEELSFDLSAGAGSPSAEAFVILYKPGIFSGDIVYFDDWRSESSCSIASPPTGQSHTLLSNRVRLDWTPQAGAVACQVQGKRLPSGPQPTQNVTGAVINTTSVPFSVAGSGTTWTWRVRCACSVSPTIVATPFSPFGDTFSVPAAREADMLDLDLTLFPNPVVDQMQLSFQAETEGMGTMTVYDLLGRTVLAQEMAWAAGAVQLPLSLQGLDNGLYLVEVRAGERTLTQRVEVRR